MIFRGSVYRNPAELDRLSKLPMRAKAAGGLSMILWLAVMTCGRWIAYYDAPDAIAMLMGRAPQVSGQIADQALIQTAVINLLSALRISVTTRKPACAVSNHRNASRLKR